MTTQSKPVTSDRIQDALYGFTRSQLLFTAIDLQLFTHIARGHNTVEKLIGYLTDRENTPQTHLEHHLDSRGLRMVLDGLVGVGFLEKTTDGQAYKLPADAAEYLVADSAHYIGGMVTHCKRLYENWSLLTDAVRSGQPVGGAQSLAQLETYFAELVKGLYVSNYPTAQKLAAAVQFGQGARQGRHILDVAGGSGVWSIALLETDPKSQATLLDLPTVIHVAEEYIQAHQLSERFDFLSEDLETFVFPQASYDVAILGNICHALGPYATEKLIANMGKTLKPGGELMIVDFVPDDNRAKPGWPLIFGVNMLVSTPEGDVFTAAQYEGWMRQAGFTHFETREIDAEVTLLLGRK